MVESVDSSDESTDSSWDLALEVDKDLESLALVELSERELGIGVSRSVPGFDSHWALDFWGLEGYLGST
jgi:hypothetical protein